MTTLESRYWQVIPTGGKISALRIELSAAPGAGTSRVITLMVNGVASALTVTISGTDTSGSDLSNEVTVAAGETVSLRSTVSGTPAAASAYVTSLWTGDTTAESLILNGSAAQVLSTTANRFSGMGSHAPATTAAAVQMLIPTAGTIKSLYWQLTPDPGNAPEAYRITARKNGVNTALTVTITADATTGNDTSNSFTVAAGDLVDFLIEPVNSPTVTPSSAFGCVFLADTDGESILCGTGAAMASGATAYNPLGESRVSWGATELDFLQATGGFRIQNFRVVLSGSPGAGKSYTLNVRGGTSGAMAATGITVAISFAGTSGSDLVNTYDATAGATMALEEVPSGTPSSRTASWGMVLTVVPAAAPSGSVTTLMAGVSMF